MKIQEWVDNWEKKVPLSLQEKWDKSGKQLGNFDDELKGIVFSLDLSEEAIEAAEELGYNLIFTHHPVFFSPLENFLLDDPKNRLIWSCLERKISVYSSHTAFDFVDGGVNDVLAEKCHFKNIRPLRPRDSQDPLYAYSKGMGRIGEISPMILEDYASLLKKSFGGESLIFYGKKDRMVKRVACLGGSGLDFAEDALKNTCDLLVTADIKYHDAQDWVRRGLCLIDLGHYVSEFPAMERAAVWSREIAKEIPLSIVANGWDSIRYAIS